MAGAERRRDGEVCMPRSDYLFTSESVAEGHPDKTCDRISDSIVDTYLAADPSARVAADQGIMFAFPGPDPPALTPPPTQPPHDIRGPRAPPRHAGEAPYFGPDA